MRAGRGAGPEVPDAAEGSRVWQQGGEGTGPPREEAVLGVLVLVFLFQTRTTAEEAETATVKTCKRCPEQVLTKTWRRDR